MVSSKFLTCRTRKQFPLRFCFLDLWYYILHVCNFVLTSVCTAVYQRFSFSPPISLSPFTTLSPPPTPYLLTSRFLSFEKPFVIKLQFLFQFIIGNLTFAFIYPFVLYGQMISSMVVGF